MPTILSHFIDASRWIGALIVLGVHGTNTLVNLGDINDAPHGLLVWIWWFFFAYNLGHQAVVGFFVLSGYLVGGAVVAALREQRDFLRDYLIHRFARIYLVLAPALVFTALFDFLGRSLPGGGVYDQPVFAGHFHPALFFANLANLQEIWAPSFGVNGPLWSLACEFWYYLICPLILLPFAKNYPARLRWGGFALGALLTIVMSIPPGFFKIGLMLWMAGAIASSMKAPPMRSCYGAIAILAVLLIVIRFTVRGPFLAAHPWLQDVSDIIQAITFLNVLLAIRFGAHEFAGAFAWLKPRWHVKLANFSFSLYSIHLPMLIFLRAVVGSIMGDNWTAQPATSAHWAVLVISLAIIIATAYGFAQLTEERTGAARRFLRERLPNIGTRNDGEPLPPTTRAPDLPQRTSSFAE